MSRTSDLAYRVANEPDMLTADERATVAAMRRQSNAYDRARQQADLGNRPVLVATTLNAGGVVCETFRVLSRSTEGHAYHVELWDNGRQVTTACNCEATGCCWHRAAARLYHTGEIEGENEAGYRLRLKAQPAAISAAMLSGKV